MTDTPRSRRGFTLIEIMIVIGILALIAALAVPNYMRYRQDGVRSQCISNLLEIRDAMYACAAHYPNLSAGVLASATPGITLDRLVSDKFLHATPKCGAGGRYSLGFVSNALGYGGFFPSCSVATHEIPTR